MRSYYFILLLVSCGPGFILAQRSFMDNFTTFFKDSLLTLFGRTGNTRGLRAAMKLDKLQPPIGGDHDFPCNTQGQRSRTPPETVNELRPGDFDVIAAMGDSLTAGNGAAASRLTDIVSENRGISWSIGGQGTWREHLTLANIIREFNTNLMGFSLADSFTHNRASQFNVAEPGSMSRDMPYMAKILVKRIRADKRVNFEKDWKLVTFMIGGNDFCADVCYKSNPKSAPLDHKRNLLATLDYLRDNLPRTFVNLVTAPSMEILINFKKKLPHCLATHLFECPCVFGRARMNRRKEMIKIMRRWQQIEEETVYDRRYKGKSDFAVVLQPFVANLHFPERETPSGNSTDWTYLSEDCFHFSQKGYARASNALWNNMLEPVGQKSLDWTDTFKIFHCPTETHPYIYTYENSGPSRDERQLDFLSKT